jgi:uncharacterized pyridoxamine 5'-phosphate oxidase family protein
MVVREPKGELDPRFSADDATPTPWADARALLDQAETYWISTVRPDGRPHVTTLIAVWLDDALYFCTGADERKAKNLEGNPHCIITTGCNGFEGIDLMIEGQAAKVSDVTVLERLAAAYASKYDSPFRFTVRDGALYNEGGGRAEVYEVAPAVAFGFGKGDPFSQTRWRF